jgi:hypothetical protein
VPLFPFELQLAQNRSDVISLVKKACTPENPGVGCETGFVEASLSHAVWDAEPARSRAFIFFERTQRLLCYLRVALEDGASMAEKLVLVGVIPEIVVIGPEEQVVWLSDTGNLKIQFDPNRCPFQSNIFQAPPGRQLQSGPPRPGTNPGSFKYRLWLNDQPVGNGEVILREK